MPRRTKRSLADPLTETEGVIELLKAGALTLDADGQLAISLASPLQIDATGDLDLSPSGVKAGHIDFGGSLSNNNGTLTASAGETSISGSVSISAGSTVTIDPGVSMDSWRSWPLPTDNVMFTDSGASNGLTLVRLAGGLANTFDVRNDGTSSDTLNWTLWTKA